MTHSEEDVIRLEAEIERLKALLSRAANALEGHGQHPDYLESLIADLRKAAQ